MISHFTRALVLAAALAGSVSALVPTASAATKFDGPWSVMIVTRAGPCDPSYRFGGQIINGIIYYTGGGPVSLTGRVTPSGAISVTVSSGANHAVGTGRLSVNSGGGTWRGQGPNGACSGNWSAQRGG
jgi:hypothetical protein